MPYKDADKQRKAVRDAVEKHRGITKGITEEGITGQGITKYPAIVYALTDPEKRKKLEKITQSLKIHKQAENVYYGYPNMGGVPFDVVGDLLEATR